jgi:hypothetical protein
MTRSGDASPRLGHRLGRRLLADVATIVTPDTILRWHANLSRVNGRTAPGVAGLEGCRLAPSPGNPDGHRESDLGLHPNPRCLEEFGAPGRALDDCAHLEGGRHPAQPRTPNDVADVHAGTLAGAPGGRFLYNRSVDPLRAADIPHGVRDRTYTRDAFMCWARHRIRTTPSWCKRSEDWRTTGMSFAPIDFSSVIGIRSGAARWRSCCGRSAFAWFAHRRPQRTAMRTRSASSDRSRRSASIAWCRWANGTFGSWSETS